MSESNREKGRQTRWEADRGGVRRRLTALRQSVGRLRLIEWDQSAEGEADS